MSIEYTIDIQLTEMGFPEIIHPQEASVAETPPNSSPSNDSLSLDHSSPVSLPDQHRQPLKIQQPTEVKEVCTLETEQTKKTLDLAQGTEAEPKHTPPAQSTQSKAIKKARMTTEEQEKGDDSDDSDVSYEEEEVEDEEDFCEEEEEMEAANTGNFQCNVCNLQCPSMFKLQDHMNLHTGARPYSCAECGKRFSQIYNYRVHLRAHAQAKAKQPRCRVCLKRFVNESDLKYHLTTNHFEDQFYECDRCKRVFTSLPACEHHIQYTCMRKVMCEKCGRYFPKEKHLKRHMASKRCFSSLKCTECPKVFTKKNALLKHSFSHLGLLPYTCVRCRCHFRLARLYLRHKCKPQSIHCVACLREFLSDDDFQQHKKDTGCWGNQEPKGDEIRCLECGQRFDTKEDLKKHAGAHQRVLKCAECGKGFRSALLLMSHMGGHAGQSPCLCQSCGLGFPHQQSYDSHLKTCGQTPQATKASKKQPSTKRSGQETLSANPAMQKSTLSEATGVNTSTSPAQSSASTSLVTGEPTISVASLASSGLATVGTDTSAAYPCLTASGPPSSSASPSLETLGQDNSSTSPNQVIQDGSTVTDPAKGCWKLSLDKPPPPGVNLVLLLPVCQNENSKLMLPCAVPQVLPTPEMQVQTSPGSNGLVGESAMNTAVRASCKQEPDPEPLDLSKKKSPSKSILNNVPLLSIKSEVKEVGVSTQIKSSDEDLIIAQATPLLSLDKNNGLSGQKRHANHKPKSDGVDPHLQLSTSPQLIDCIHLKKIKMEADRGPYTE